MILSPVISGLLVSTFAFICFSGYDATIKFMARDYAIFQCMAVAYALATLFSALFAAVQARGALRRLALRRPGLHAARGLAQLGGSLLMFWGLRSMPLTDFYLIVFLIPVFVALLSAFFLNEKMTAALVVAVTFSFAGVVLAFGLGNGFGMPHLYALGGAVLNGVAATLLRELGKTEQEGMMAVTVNLALALGSALLAAPQWKAPSPEFWQFAFLGGAFYALAMTGISFSFRLAPAGIASVPQFLQLVWGALIGAFVFNENPPASVFLGGAVVIAANLFLIAMQNRKAAPTLS